MDLSIVFKIIGIGGCFFCFYTGFQLRKKRERLHRSGILTDAVVTELTKDGDHERPTIQFKTPAGELITKRYEIGFHTGQLKEGQTVNIFYNQQNPADFVLDTKVEKWLPVIFMTVGLLLLLLLLISLITGAF
jgi:Protein of unknown function (DUF3592)